MAGIDKTLAHFNSSLQEQKESALLVGGLAVGYHDSRRSSEDIDLYVSRNGSNAIANRYGSDKWDIENENNDERRPQFVLTPRANTDGKRILFGPKLADYDRYPHLRFKSYLKNAKPYKFGKHELSNILVPEMEALAYTKLVSFIERVERTPEKGQKDLDDFVLLSNHKDFRINALYDHISEAKANDWIREQFPRINEQVTSTDDSRIFSITDMLGTQRINISSDSAFVEENNTKPVGAIIQERIGLRENNSREIKCYSGHLIPGLLQSLDYATLVMHDGGVREPNAAADARGERQKILKNGDKEFRFLFHESALEPLLTKSIAIDPKGNEILSTAAAISSIEFMLKVIEDVPLKLQIGVLPSEGVRSVLFRENYVVYDDKSVDIEIMACSFITRDEAYVNSYTNNFAELFEQAIQGNELKVLLRNKLTQLTD